MDRQVFSFRAEASVDIQRFLAALNDAEIEVGALWIQRPVQIFGDSLGEFCTDAGVTVQQLRDAASDAVDVHVLLETLRPVPLGENSLERDQTFYPEEWGLNGEPNG